jgi:predicted nucleic acid-binding protein
VTGYLVDTNVISEVIKPGPNPQVVAWLRQADPLALYASVITFGEIRLGVENAPGGRRRDELEAWLGTGLPGWFARNLLPVTKDIADQWGRASIKAKRQGIQLATNDGLIAGTALVHDLTLVTRNVRDFAGLGLMLLNPWDTP